MCYWLPTNNQSPLLLLNESLILFKFGKNMLREDEPQSQPRVEKMKDIGHNLITLSPGIHLEFVCNSVLANWT